MALFHEIEKEISSDMHEMKWTSVSVMNRINCCFVSFDCCLIETNSKQDLLASKWGHQPHDESS